MVHELKPYPTYKDSGIPWLGKVPDHWGIERVKWVASLNPSKTESRSSLAPDTRVTFLPMERVGVDGRIDASETPPARLVWNGFTYFRRNDVLVAKITPCFENGKGAYLGTLPTDVGFGSTEFHVLRATPSISPQFLYRLTTVAEFRRLGADAMTGAAGQQRVPQSFVANFRITLPPLSEQSAVVRFLDHADRRIRRYIRAKRRLMALLNEQKQAIIYRAVTSGLDPHVRLKPSGVEWLGDVPEHWEVRRAKYFYREVDERSSTGEEELLSVSHISGVTPRSEKNITMFMASSYVGHKLCRPGDLVVNTMWAWMGALGVAKQSGIVSPSYGVYRPIRDSKLLGDYADLLLRTRPYINEYTCRSTGIRLSRLRLYPEQFLRLRLVCPSAEEQRSILDHVTTETAATDRAMASTQREIGLVREYRTRLIADVVTGELDVRAAAACLPEEVEAREPLDEVDALTDAGENTEDVDLDAEPEAAEA